VEPVVFRRLKLLNYLRQINLRPEDTLALIRRLETDSLSPEDCEVLIRIVQAHTELSVDCLQTSPADEPSSLARQVKRPRQGAKRTRRRADR
jgi:hypothetical protein